MRIVDPPIRRVSRRRTVTAVRTELGSRIGKSWHVPDGSVLDLFGKAAWAPDEISDPRLNVSFVGLP